jgi:hypothetical protein
MVFQHQQLQVNSSGGMPIPSNKQRMDVTLSVIGQDMDDTLPSTTTASSSVGAFGGDGSSAGSNVGTSPSMFPGIPAGNLLICCS